MNRMVSQLTSHNMQEEVNSNGTIRKSNFLSPKFVSFCLNEIGIQTNFHFLPGIYVTENNKTENNSISDPVKYKKYHD